MVLIGAPFALEASALLFDQERALAVWGRRGYELSPSLQATAYFPLVSDDMVRRVPDESVGRHSTNAGSYRGGCIRDAAGHILPQSPSFSVSHDYHSEAIHGDQGTLEHGTEVLSVAASRVAYDTVNISVCDMKTTGVLEADIAHLPLGAEKNPLFLSLGMEAELIELPFAQTAPSEETWVQSQESQNDIGLFPVSIKIDSGNSLNWRVGIASDDRNIGANVRITNPTVTVSGDVAVRRRSSMPTLTFDESITTQFDSFNSVNVMPPHISFSFPRFDEIHEARAPVNYEISDNLALSGSLIPLGAQISAGTGSELMNNGGLTDRAGGFSLDVSSTAGFETNPFLIDLPDTGTASLRLSLLPTFSRQGARGDVRLSARIEQIEYTESYDAVQNVGANFGSRFKLNERLEGNVDLSFDSGVFVTNFTGQGPVDGAPDDGGGLSGGDDITLLGLDQPRNQYQAGAGLRYQHSEHDELGVSMSFRADRFEEPDLQDLQESDFLAGQISYARQISSGLTIGMAVDASSIDFVDQSLGEITTISPQAIVGLTFSPTWELTGSLGIASIRSDTSFSEETSTAFSGDFSICRNGVRANLCLTGARQVVPFGVGGAGLQSNVGVAYSLRLSERETFSLNANYGRASEAFFADGGGIETIGGLLSYQLELAERVRLSADARYTDLRLDLGSNVSNFQVLVGLTVRVGRAR